MSEEKSEMIGEPKTAKVIVTTDTGREIRFRADEWDAEEQLDVLTASRNYVASFAAGRWTSVRLDGMTDDDRHAALDLAVARKALDKIWSNVNGPNRDLSVVAKIIDETCDTIGWPE